GTAKATVESACGACHGLDLITSGGRSAADWKTVVNKMVGFGADIPDDQVTAVLDYLTKNFPDKAAAPVIAAGSVKVEFKEWKTPTSNTHPHDPLATRDGNLWYTGQNANLLGRVDTKTGEIKEFKMTTPNSGPHGLTEDKDGNIWFTANSAGYVGKLHPKTDK